jgi:hypothetical protein
VFSLGFAGLNVHFFSLMQYCRRNIVQAAFAIIFPRKSSAAADATILVVLSLALIGNASGRTLRKELKVDPRRF